MARPQNDGMEDRQLFGSGAEVALISTPEPALAESLADFLGPDCPRLPPHGTDFLERILRIQLVAPAFIRRFLDQNTSRLNEFSDAMILGRELVQADLLTPYQLDRIMAGTVHGLILGNYKVRERLGAGTMGVVFLVASKPYRLARIVHYFDSKDTIIDRIDSSGRIKAYLSQSLTSRDTNYQAEQSKIAVGAGGPLGLGLMQGKQKLLYLPEAHTDFIYAVVGEELGLVGSLFVLAGFLVILWRGLRATVLMPDDFGRYLALGVTTMLVVQAFMNMSVVLGLLPNKGIPLPMISSGGSSLVSTLASLGILMNVSEHAG